MSVDFPQSATEAVKILLQSLPAKRMRDVVERRGGLKGGRAATLEEIGKGYKITRERVRQIEADAMRRLRERDQGDIMPLLVSFESILARHGGVMAARHLFSESAPARLHPHVALLLRAAPQFAYLAEDESLHPRWASDPVRAADAAAALGRVIKRLEAAGSPISEADLDVMLAEEAAAFTKDGLPGEVRASLLGSSKLIKRTPYGEYGLISWATVVPRGIKDKAYAAVLKAGRPLHFREVAAAIDRAGWGGRKRAHPQTVHNELIKDARFTLVGRGMYALKEWGYEPGTVRDIIVSILSRAATPLGKDEIVKMVSERRMVKPQTILLNLQDRSRFKRTEGGAYALA